MKFIVAPTQTTCQKNTNCVYANFYTTEIVKLTCRDRIGYFKLVTDLNLSEGVILLNKHIRGYLNAPIDSEIDLIEWNAPKTFIKEIIFQVRFILAGDVTRNHSPQEISFDVVFPTEEVNTNIKVKKEMFLNTCLIIFEKIPIHQQTQYVLPLGEYNALLMVMTNGMKGMFINSNTNITLSPVSKYSIPTVIKESKNVFKKEFSMNSMSLGISNELITIFKKVFITRPIPNDIRKDLGIKHIKGIILEGEPGCGKNIIAQELSKLIKCKSIKIVTGPSLLNSPAGQMEENIQNLFAEACAEPNEFFIIVLDECEAIFKQRGDLIHDNITDQILSMIDGPTSLNNILLIGMTNFIEEINETVIRPGRLELVIHIGLPDQTGQVNIFKVDLTKISHRHAGLRTNNLPVPNVSGNVAGAGMKETIGFMGSAVGEFIPNQTKTMHRCQITVTPTGLTESIVSTTCDLEPTSKEYQILLRNPFVPTDIYWDAHAKLMGAPFGRVNTILLFGSSLDTAIMACNLAKNSENGCIKFINSEVLVNEPRHEELYDNIDYAATMATSTIILCSVEKIIKYNPIMQICDNDTLQIINILLEKVIDLNCRMNVIITSSNPKLVKSLFEETIDHFEV